MRLWIQWILVTVFFCASVVVFGWQSWWMAGVLTVLYFGSWVIFLQRRHRSVLTVVASATGCCFFLFLFQPELLLIAVHPTPDELNREFLEQVRQHVMICGRVWPDWWEFRLNIVPWYTRFVPDVLYLWAGIILVTALGLCRRKKMTRPNQASQPIAGKPGSG
jgi:hypothetical protein